MMVRPNAARSREFGRAPHLGIWVALLLAGCGVAPTERKLVGAWQVDLPPPQAIVFAFQKDHTYTMTIGGQPGTVHGTWRLDAGVLTTTMGAFAAYGMTNALPPVKVLGGPKQIIVTLTNTKMVWRDPLHGSTLKLKRVAAASSAAAKSAPEMRFDVQPFQG